MAQMPTTTGKAGDMQDDEQDETPQPKPLKRDTSMPKLSDIVMLDRGCQLWVSEARRSNITNPARTNERIRYQIRLEKRAADKARNKGDVGRSKPVIGRKKPDGHKDDGIGER